MFMTMMSLLIIASAALFGGNPAHLATIKLRHTGLIMAALAVQVVITTITTHAPHNLLVALHLATYAAAGLALWANRRLPGIIIIGIGAALNGVVIALNGGTLPASAHALTESGHPVRTTGFTNSGVVHHPILPWLGDIVATPSWLPFRNVLSIGDMIILIGAVILVHAASHSKPWRLIARSPQQNPA